MFYATQYISLHLLDSNLKISQQEISRDNWWRKMLSCFIKARITVISYQLIASCESFSTDHTSNVSWTLFMIISHRPTIAAHITKLFCERRVMIRLFTYFKSNIFSIMFLHRLCFICKQIKPSLLLEPNDTFFLKSIPSVNLVISILLTIDANHLN